MSHQGVELLRQRYEELSEELAEAEQAHDRTRQERLEGELGQLADQVRKAVGRQGRVRQQSDAERARIAVTKALARARDLLSVHHPALCDHLLAAVSVGSVLTYRPSEPFRWTT